MNIEVILNLSFCKINNLRELSLQYSRSAIRRRRLCLHPTCDQLYDLALNHSERLHSLCEQVLTIVPTGNTGIESCFYDLISLKRKRQMYMGDILSPVRDDVERLTQGSYKIQNENIDIGELQTTIKIQVYT